MPPRKNKPADEKTEAAQPIFHLVHATSKGKPLCGETSPTALIGSYVEHVDGAPPHSVRWVREIFDHSGKVVTPCHLCLSIYPPVLLDVVPFELLVKVRLNPNQSLSGYEVSTESIAIIGTKKSKIVSRPSLSYFAARWIGDLHFSVDIDANAVVPLVEHANKTKK